MRIGFDMLAVQSPHHGHRGIGRYSRDLVRAVLMRDDGHEYVLYAHAALPSEQIPTSPNALTRVIGPDSRRGEVRVGQYLDRLTRENPDDLDALVVLSPFEHWEGYQPPVPEPGGPRLATVIYDTIPFLAPEQFYAPRSMPRFYRVLESLRRYDVLLAISEATRADTTALLEIPGDRVVNISAACDARVFTPPAGPLCEADRRTLRLLGITRPFVLNVGGMDARKNPWGLIDAFAQLPGDLSLTHQLVFAFRLSPEAARKLREYAERRGVGDSVVVMGEADDRQLHVLYQRCAVYAFPSTYEGFGLPLLEALSSGAPVVAGNNSSQPEVVGDAGLLADASSPADFAAKLGRVLGDPALAADLRSRAVAQAANFSWEKSAARAVGALEGLEEPAANRPAAWRRADPGHARKPRVAFFSPLPPRRSGVADYALSLLRELRSEYEIDVYHDAGYVPDPGVSGEFLCRDHRTFSRYAPAVGYDAVVYQMGNSRYHAYLYPIMLAHPGVVTLHDVCLVGLHLDLGARSGAGLGVLRDELTRWYPESAARLQERLGGWSNGAAREEIERACVAEGWLLNRRLLASENLVVVHSPWSRDRLFEQDPGASERVELIPLGGVPRRLSDDERAAVRDRFDIPRDALVVASLGFVHPDKLGAEALDAFAGAARDVPSALFVFVGEEADGGVARGHAASLGLGDRVRFLGRRTLDEFADLASAADVGVNLRRPPTNGETSAALLQFLGSGVATVVTDVGTFSDFPDAVVRKVAWDEGGPGRLGDVLRGLMTDDPARKALGDAAREHVRLLHAWPVVAGQYVEVIERARAAARGGTSGPKNPANAPAVAAGPWPQELAR